MWRVEIHRTSSKSSNEMHDICKAKVGRLRGKFTLVTLSVCSRK